MRQQRVIITGSAQLCYKNKEPEKLPSKILTVFDSNFVVSHTQQITSDLFLGMEIARLV